MGLLHLTLFRVPGGSRDAGVGAQPIAWVTRIDAQETAEHGTAGGRGAQQVGPVS